MKKRNVLNIVKHTDRLKQFLQITSNEVNRKESVSSKLAKCVAICIPLTSVCVCMYIHS